MKIEESVTVTGRESKKIHEKEFFFVFYMEKYYADL